MNHRVAVTGIGVVSSAGIGKEIFFKNCSDGRVGLKKCTLFPTEKLSTDFFGEVEGNFPSPCENPAAESRVKALMRPAIEEMMRDSGLDRAAVASYGLEAQLCFGTLVARSKAALQTIQTLVAQTKPTALRVLDLNLRAPFVDRGVIEILLGLANVLKLNDEELTRLAAMFEISGNDVNQHAEQFIDEYNLKLLILTCGSQGSRIFADGKEHFCESRKIEVVDTVGAGDAFTAMSVVGLLTGMPMDAVNERANEIAAFVCTQSGATPKIDGIL